MTHPWEKQRPLSSWLPGGLSGEKEGKVSRNNRAVLDPEKCIKCNLCWIYCPEGCIQRGEVYTIDLSDCRGCGVCAQECKQDAIEMIREDKL